MNNKEIDIKTKYEVFDRLLQQLPKEFIELMNGIPFDSELAERIIENS